MNRTLIILCALLGTAMSFISFPDGALSVLTVLIFSFPVLYIIRNYSEEKEFLTNVFLIALLARLVFGFIIQLLDIKMLIAEDSRGYDMVGVRIVDMWRGIPVPNDIFTYRAKMINGPGWGMNYLVGAIYYITGKSFFAAQSFCAVVGAATAPAVYFCAEKIYHNRRVAKISAILIALFPSFILWSAQLLKDGLIIFLLVLAMTMVLQLQVKLSYPAIIILLLSLFGILSLRFYIFYMVIFAVVGSFLIGLNTSAESVVRRTLIMVFLGLGLTYFGVIRNASSDIQQYGSLERVQLSRQDLATTNSGFGEDVDVSTVGGAISAIPIGITYLMLAPFPWQMNNLRQLITLPEILIWWSMIPLIFIGLWYTIKNRLRSAMPILIFALMLTLAYSIFQGNVGTAYRQRTQIQVFLFIFVGVGWTLFKERSENQKEMKRISRQKVERNLRNLKEIT